MVKGDFKIGIIRVGGRVDLYLFFYNGKCFVFLLRDYWILVFIIRNIYRVCYFGVVVIIVKIRRKYWIIKGINVAKIIK